MTFSAPKFSDRANMSASYSAATPAHFKTALDAALTQPAYDYAAREERLSAYQKARRFLGRQV